MRKTRLRYLKSAKQPIPQNAKKIGNKVNVNFEKWMPNAKTALQKACSEKFKQDVRAKDFLLKTGETILAEASKSKTWGVGLTLKDNDIGTKSKWTGQNILGNILTEIRQQLK